MESVKKTIVMLQLAKRSVSKNVKETNQTEAVQVVQQEVAQLSISSTSSSVHSGENPLNGNTEDGGGMGEEFKTPQKGEEVAATGVPLLSYSSTDDENDDFEDAYEEVQPQEPQGECPASLADNGDKKEATSDISLAKVSSKDFFMDEDEGMLYHFFVLQTSWVSYFFS